MGVTLGYWFIRGLGAHIRYLLHHVGAEFEDKQYTNFEVWMREKHSLGLKLPNLPYLYDGDYKITESNAILAYLGRKHNLAGKTEQERIIIDMATFSIMEFRNNFIYLCYFDDYEGKKASYAKNLPTVLKKFSDFLGEKKFIVGDDVTYPDFHLFETLDVHLEWEKNCLDEFPILEAYHKRMSELPGVKAYRESDAFKRRPIHSPVVAKWF